MKKQLGSLSGNSTSVVWSVILAFIALGSSCSGDAVTEPGFAEGKGLTPSFLPPGETCQGHPFDVDGGAEEGGLTFYHNLTCSDEFVVYYYLAGDLESFSGNYNEPYEPSVDTFCRQFPGVNSCQVLGTPIGEDAEGERWCLGGHPGFDEPVCTY
jgi:hypothetical protein